MKKDLLTNFNFPQEKMVVINNPIDFDKINEFTYIKSKESLPKEKFNLLIVGRLTYQKRVDHAIKAMQYLSDEYHLTILGEGE